MLRNLKRLLHVASSYGRSCWSKTAFEKKRLARLPRYVETSTDLPGFPFSIPDAASFLASWEEIFCQEIYDFKSTSEQPRILDCGANVGLSSLYFHRRYPNSRITAFEPDPKIFAYLDQNLKSAGVTNLDLCNKAVWTSSITLKFQSEGSDAGRIDSGIGTNSIEVETVRLRDYLNERIDFLKLDIEGAEGEVIMDIAPFFHNIENIFVEYHSFADRPQMLGNLIKILTDGGFRLQIHHMCPSPKPFVHVRTNLGMDMQLNIFGYRPAANAGDQTRIEGI